MKKLIGIGLILALVIPLAGQWMTAPIVVNVKDYGATGGGVADDRLAIQAAITAVKMVGGGIVFFPAGTYVVSEASHPQNANYSACLIVYSNITLQGAGAGATTIKRLGAGVIGSGKGAVIWNRYIGTLGGDQNICIRDLTVDGNGAGQYVDAQHGIAFLRARSVRYENVRVKNVKGTTAGQGNGMFFEFQFCTEGFYSNCEAMNDDGSVGWTGFHSNNSNMVRYSDCIAHGTNLSMGFGDYKSRSVQYTNCHAYQVLYDQFNTEWSADVLVSNCIGGGKTQTYSATPGYPAGTDLGGALYGMVILGSTDVLVQGLSLQGNNVGLWISDIASGMANIAISGVNVSNSATTAIRIPKLTETYPICLNNIISENCGHELDIYGSYYFLHGTMIVPAIPETGLSKMNPYPFPCSVTISGGEVSGITVNGSSMGITSGTVVLGNGDSITITYNMIPSWQWVSLL